MRNLELRTWIAENADNLVKKRGMTFKAVSEMTGIPYSSLNSKRKGLRAFSIEDLLLIAEATNEPITNFLPDELLSSRHSDDDSALAEEEKK